jgi:hypothetical protein
MDCGVIPSIRTGRRSGSRVTSQSKSLIDMVDRLTLLMGRQVAAVSAD